MSTSDGMRMSHLRYIKIHIILTLAIRRSLEIAGTAALDLYAAASLLLNMLHIRTAMANDLGAQVETWNRLKVNGDAGLGPFALFGVSKYVQVQGLTFASSRTRPNSSRSTCS